MYVVNQKKCTGCGTCTDVCPTEAIRIAEGKAQIGMECMDCGACPRVCPEGAIRKQPTGAPAALGAARD
jgi:ferredoxin